MKHLTISLRKGCEILLLPFIINLLVTNAIRICT